MSREIPQSQFHRSTSDNIIALPRTLRSTKALSVSSLDHRVDSLECNIVLPIKSSRSSGRSRVESDGAYRSPRLDGLFAGFLTIKITPQA